MTCCVDRAEENRIFAEMTEKPDLYVRLLAEQGLKERVREFCAPGGEYVRCALKEFVFELLYECLSPFRYEDTDEPGVEKVFDTVRKKLSGKMTVTEGTLFGGFMSVDLDDWVRIKLNHYVYPNPIEVTAEGPDDDAEWKYPVARVQNDEFTLDLLNEGLEDPFPMFADRADDFCGWMEYIFDNMDRYKSMTEEKAAALREQYGLRG